MSHKLPSALNSNLMARMTSDEHLTNFSTSYQGRVVLHMAGQTAFRLLDLPRELRDNIYDHITDGNTGGHCSPLPVGGFIVWLKHNFTLPISMTCKRIHAEYTDRALACSQLDVYCLDSFEGGQWLLLQPEHAGQGLSRILKKIKACELKTGVRELIRGHAEYGEDNVSEWMFASSVEDLRSQDEAKWTPSKGMSARGTKRGLVYLQLTACTAFVADLRQTVSSMLPYLSEGAIVKVQLDLTDLTTEFEMCHEIGFWQVRAFWLDVESPPTKELEDRLATIIDLPTLSTFSKDMKFAFPTHSVTLELARRTALFYNMATNSRQIVRNREAIKRGDESAITRPQARASWGGISWRLLLTSDIDDWRDGFAEFVEESTSLSRAWW